MGGRCRVVTLLLFLALTVPSTVLSLPSGVGVEANEGCLCHAPVDQTSVMLDGLPERYESNTSYTLTLTVENPDVAEDGQYRGGFRVLVSNGTIAMNESKGQMIDGGWTQTEAGAHQRSWVMVWTSPSENNSRTDFTIHANAVNGNNAPTGDGWSSLDIAVAGTAFEGTLDPAKGIDGVGWSDKVLLVGGLVLILGLLWVSARSS